MVSSDNGRWNGRWADLYCVKVIDDLWYSKSGQSGTTIINKNKQLWLCIHWDECFLQSGTRSANKNFGLNQFGPRLAQSLPGNGVPCSNCEWPLWVKLVRFDDAGLTSVKDTMFDYSGIRVLLVAVE
jgi:hypothetical protein